MNEKIDNKPLDVVPVFNSISSQAINKSLEEIGYAIDNSSLCLLREKRNKMTGEIEKEYTPVSNVLPLITEQIIYKNGKDEEAAYVVNGVLLDSNIKLPSITISVDDLNNVRYLSNPNWKRQAILRPIPCAEKHLKYVVDSVSKDFLQCKDVYTHTGFTRINDKLIYLYHGGVIGDIENVNVDLSRDRLEQYHFTNKTFELQEALKTSYSILNLADVKITIPLLATIYLSPLVSIYRENGLYADYILWVEGKTGSRKSTAIAVLLSHFGQFSRNSLPCSFRDSINSLEKKAFILKDVPVCLDDFNPETVGISKTVLAEKIFAMYGDRAGRDRMNANGKTLKSPYIARGLAIVTAEYFPEVAQSRLARAIVVDVKQNSFDLNKLRNLQENAELLSFAMKEFISWIIKNEEKIISESKELYKKLENETQTNDIHGRTNETINIMKIGFYLFLKFLQQNEVITQEELEEKNSLCSGTLNELARHQNIEIESQNPVNMFKEALEQLYETEKVQIMDYNAPDNILPNRTLIGYIDHKEEKYYFLPNVLYKVIVRFCNEQGIKFPISKSALLKYLDNEGYLYRTPKSDRRTIKKKVRNAVLPVIAVYQNKLTLGMNNETITEGNRKVQEDLRKSLNKNKN